jgi:hypothetical protein
MQKKRYQIGIDPDVDKSGVGIWDTHEKKITYMGTMRFWELVAAFKSGYFGGEQIEGYSVNLNVEIHIEGGWLVKKSNWHLLRHETSGLSIARKKGIEGVIAFMKSLIARKEKIAKNVGENHQTGKLLCQWCETYDVPFRVREPMGKMDAKTFNKYTGHTGKSNQEIRDAVFLVWKI